MWLARIRQLARIATPLMLLSLCVVCTGCGLLGIVTVPAGQRVSSAPVEERAAWREYSITCGNEKIVFRSPSCSRYAPRIRERPPADVKNLFVVYYQGFDAEWGTDIFPGFDIEVVVLATDPSDPLRHDPTGFARMETSGMNRDRGTYEVVFRINREWVILRGYSDKEKKYLLGSDYESIVGGFHVRFSFGYRHGYYGDYEGWIASRRKIEEDVMASLRIVPAE